MEKIKRYSRQRELIYEAIVSSHEHPTADHIYNQLKTDNPELSLGTVYRNIKQLEDAGMIVKICNGGSSDRYDGRRDMHFHFTCNSCSDVYDVDLSLSKEALLKTTDNISHFVEGLNINLYGKCQKCMGKEMS